MAKILIATEKPFAKIAVDGIKRGCRDSRIGSRFIGEIYGEGTTSGGSGRRGSHDNPQ